MTNTVSQKMRSCWSAVSVIRRSSGSRGRIEIRFSCCASQFTAFMNRSRLPWMPSQPFEAKSESPNTTMRVSGLLVSSGLAPAAGARHVGRRGRHRGGQRDRTGLVSLLEIARDLSGRVQRLDVGLAPAVGAGLDQRLRELAAGAAGRRRHRPCQPIRGQQVEALGDRVRLVLGGDRRFGPGAEQLAHAADVHHHVVADLDRPVLEQRGDAR